MHPPAVREEALRLVAAGLNDCEISRRMGIPRATIRDWRRPSYVPRASAPPRQTCPRCWRTAKPMSFLPEDYAELLALYLGDGCISEHPRTARLRIALDSKYPEIIREARMLLERCFPYNGIDAVLAHGGSCTHLSLYCSHLPCLFPQHGPGAKHKRTISLEPWQWELIELAPWAFLRGCIRSDGCAFVNRTGAYEYLSYDFCNMSWDIVQLFIRTCELVGVRYRATGSPGRAWRVRVNRRESVNRMLEHVGLKT
jgi:hypothetical protein